MRTGTFLKQIRESRGLSLREVEALCGVPLATLHRIEAGKHRPDIYCLYVISKTLRCSYKKVMELATEDARERAKAKKEKQ